MVTYREFLERKAQQCLLPAWQMRAVDRMSQVDVRRGAELFWDLVLAKHQTKQRERVIA